MGQRELFGNALVDPGRTELSVSYPSCSTGPGTWSELDKSPPKKQGMGSALSRG